MKAVSLAVVLVMVSGKSLCQADPALLVNMSTTAQSSENIEPASSQHTRIDPGKEASIRKLLELEGSNACLDLPLQNLDKAGLLSQNPQPGQDRFTNLLITRLKEKIRSDEINVGVTVYKKQFSQSEIDGLVSFYNSPLARKEISIRDQVLVETRSRQTKLMMQWSQDAGTEILNENPDLRKKMKADPNRNPKR